MNVKTIAIFFCLFLAFGLNANAQEFHYGVVVGADIADIKRLKGENSSYVGDYDPIASFNVNAYVKIQHSKRVGFSVEPGFMRKGGKDTNSDKNLYLNYFQLPVSANIYLNERLHFSFGPEFSYLVSTGSEVDALKDSYFAEDFEVSGALGINYNVYNKFGVGLKYNHGFTPIASIVYTDEMGNSEDEIKDYNQYLQLSFRYMIN